MAKKTFICFYIITMSAINHYKSFKTYKKEYSSWRNEKDLAENKRQEYLRLNPNKIAKEDIQKTKSLLRAVDLMDEYTYKKTEMLEILTDLVINTGLQYAAIGGTALGFLLTKNKSFNNVVKKLSKNNNKKIDMINFSFTTLMGILSTIIAFPIYNWASKAETKAYRKTRHEVMQNDLKNPKIFATLTEAQELQLEKNIKKFEKKKGFLFNPVKTFKEKVNEIEEFSKETFAYRKDKKRFENELFSDNKFFDEELSPKEIENAKSDQQILLKLADEINVASQDYQEKAEIVTTSLITGGFALGSLFALGYERLMKKLKLKSNSIPANLGMFLMLGMSIIGISLQKKASHIGRFKAKQELMNNPEKLVYISDEKTGDIKDVKFNRKKLTTWEFLKNAWNDRREYEMWQEEIYSREKNLTKAYEGIKLSEKQIKDAKRLQRNVFKTFSKLDDNTQKHAESVAILGQAIQYPLTLVLNTFAGIYGAVHLNKIASATTKQAIASNSAKYIGTILLFALPSIYINNKIIREEKEAKQISDMLTLKGMEDYREFADYSRFKTES